LMVWKFVKFKIWWFDRSCVFRFSNFKSVFYAKKKHTF
jgi:hypothetical protein